MPVYHVGQKQQVQRWRLRSGIGSGANGVYVVGYNGTTTSAVVSDGVAIQDLADSAFTAEAWIRTDGYGENDSGRIFRKGVGNAVGWELSLYDAGGIYTRVLCATTHALTSLSPSDWPVDGEWHHITLFFDDAGDRKCHVARDGVWFDVSGETAGVDAILSDVGEDLYIGNSQNGAFTFDGALGWCRISDNDRYSHGVDFSPRTRLDPPAPDGNTVVLYHMNEGTGTNLDNAEGTAAYDATLSNGTWEIS